MRQFIKCVLYVVSPVRGGRRFSRAWWHAFEQAGAGGVGVGEATQPVRENYKSFKGINGKVLGGMHQFVMYIL